MKYVSNAFSLQMVDNYYADYDLTVQTVTKAIFDKMAKEAKSIIGHEDFANLLGLTFNRESVTLKKGDVLYVAQLTGGRLPEGTTTLPPDFSIKYLVVEIL